MKIQLASDLHLEMRDSELPSRREFVSVEDRDVLILAGDIGADLLARRFVQRELGISPVIYVPGNHEYYTVRTRAEVDADWKAFGARSPRFHYLVSEGVEIRGIRFFGAPWYSNFWGRLEPEYFRMIERSIADFDRRLGYGEWTADKHVELHDAQTRLLERQAGKVDVVVTHWPPSLEAIHPRYAGSQLNPYFINDKAWLVEKIGAKLWVSGHTHEPYEYRLWATRCIGNPCGYVAESRGPNYRPGCVVEI